MNKIITIGREFGSGGRELGRRLADKLGYQYYDKEIIREISKKTSLSEGYISHVLDNNQLFPITIESSLNFVNPYQLNQIRDIYEAQKEILIKLAEKSNCVIVGRCADVILKDYHPFRIFVHASFESRIARCIERKKENENFTLKELKKYIKKIDKQRSKYYEFYTGLTWGDKSNYDLCINTTDKNIKEVVLNLLMFFNKK